MKTLDVGLQSARRVNDVISDVKVLNEMLEPICSNEWLLQTEKEEEEEIIKDTVQFYFDLVGILKDEYEVCEI